jgi:alkyl hydroperoxide reductase subunit AhpC
LHENLDQLKDLDIEMYIVSSDTPEQQLQLYNALVEKYGKSVPFISDTNLDIMDLFHMKNGDVAYRGYGLLSKNGDVVFHTRNDNWGEELEQTVKEIKEEYKKTLKESTTN